MRDAPTDTTGSSSTAAIPTTTVPSDTATYDLDRRGTVCPAIVDAVSEAIGVPADEMERPLNDVVDVDALEQIFRSRLDGTARSGGRIQFSYYGCAVVLDSSLGEMGVYVLPE